MSRKPWDICNRIQCWAPTWSGRKEANPKLRHCIGHDPERRIILKRASTKAERCKSHRRMFRHSCHLPAAPLQKGTASSSRLLCLYERALFAYCLDHRTSCIQSPRTRCGTQDNATPSEPVHWTVRVPDGRYLAEKAFRKKPRPQTPAEKKRDYRARKTGPPLCWGRSSAHFFLSERRARRWKKEIKDAQLWRFYPEAARRNRQRTEAFYLHNDAAHQSDHATWTEHDLPSDALPIGHHVYCQEMYGTIVRRGVHSQTGVLYYSVKLHRYRASESVILKVPRESFRPISKTQYRKRLRK